jgi:hypothetical protein
MALGVLWRGCCRSCETYVQSDLCTSVFVQSTQLGPSNHINTASAFKACKFKRLLASNFLVMLATQSRISRRMQTQRPGTQVTERVKEILKGYHKALNNPPEYAHPHQHTHTHVSIPPIIRSGSFSKNPIWPTQKTVPVLSLCEEKYNAWSHVEYMYSFKSERKKMCRHRSLLHIMPVK